MTENKADAAPAGAAPMSQRADLAIWLDRLLETSAVLLSVAAVVIAVMQVMLRYFFNHALPWPEEVAQWLFCWAVFLGMPIAIHRNAHIRVDVITRLMSPRVLAVHGVIVHSVVAAASVMMLIHGIDYVGRVIQVAPATQWSMKYFFVAAPVGAALNLFFLLWPRPGTARWSGVLPVALGAVIYYVVIHGTAGLYAENGSATALMIFGLILILAGVPIAFAMAFGAFAAFAPLGDILLITVTQNMAASLNSYTLLAIPFFILAAAAMNAGGITPRLVELASQLVGHFRGGLGQANVVANMMLAGISGSSTADASTIAKLLVPEMEKRGYNRAFGSALTAASATIANLIPPGLGLIIYAALASVSVGALFVATIVPGLIVSAALMIVVYFISRRRGYGGDVKRATARERLVSLRLAIPALILPAIIVGGVRFGAFTATEGGAIAFAYALFCGAFLYRELTVSNLIAAAREAVLDTVIVAIIIATAAPFAWVLTFEQVPQHIASGLGTLISMPLLLLLTINAFLLIVGLFMEMIAALVILVPILVPIVVSAGIDPIHFGIIIVLNLVIGALTPPLGVLVFTTARVGNADVVATFRAIIPFVLAMIAALAVVSYVPAFSMLPVQWFGP